MTNRLTIANTKMSIAHSILCHCKYTSNFWNPQHRLLFAFVEHLRVYLRSLYAFMSEQFLNGIDVRSEVEHKHCKGMSAAVECDFAIYTGIRAQLP